MTAGAGRSGAELRSRAVAHETARAVRWRKRRWAAPGRDFRGLRHSQRSRPVRGHDLDFDRRRQWRITPSR